MVRLLLLLLQVAQPEPLTPEQTVALFKVPDGFSVQLVAGGKPRIVPGPAPPIWVVRARIVSREMMRPPTAAWGSPRRPCAAWPSPRRCRPRVCSTRAAS